MLPVYHLPFSNIMLSPKSISHRILKQSDFRDLQEQWKKLICFQIGRTGYVRKKQCLASFSKVLEGTNCAFLSYKFRKNILYTFNFKKNFFIKYHRILY